MTLREASRRARREPSHPLAAIASATPANCRSCGGGTPSFKQHLPGHNRTCHLGQQPLGSRSIPCLQQFMTQQQHAVLQRLAGAPACSGRQIVII